MESFLFNLWKKEENKGAFHPTARENCINTSCVFLLNLFFYSNLLNQIMIIAFMKFSLGVGPRSKCFACLSQSFQKFYGGGCYYPPS